MAPPTPLICQVPGCAFVTPANIPNWELLTQNIQQHYQYAHPAPEQPAAAPAATAKLERLPRPTFSLNMTEAAWQFKVIEWRSYIGQTNTTPDSKLLQLRAACDEDLRQRVYDSGNYTGLDTENKLLDKMKELAVIKIHKSVHLMTLYRMVQESDEGIRAFVARVTGTADMCAMTVKCPSDGCNTDVPYRDEVVQQVIIHGMANMDVKQRVLSRSGSGELDTLAKLVDYISAEEAALTETVSLSAPSHSLSYVRQSGYKQQGKVQSKQLCKFCGAARHTPSNTAEDRKKLCGAFGKTCTKCQKRNHFSSVCQSGRHSQAAVAQDVSDNSIGSITASNLYSPETFAYPENSLTPTGAADLLPVVGVLRGEGPVTCVPLPHHVHDTVQGWHQSKAPDSPSLPVTFSIDKTAYAALGLNIPRLRNNISNKNTSGHATADTGAQLTVLPATLLDSMGIRLDSIFPVQSRLNGAQNAPIMVEGGILLKITATNPQTQVSKTSHQLCYVSRLVTSTYLSFSACVDLGLVPSSFSLSLTNIYCSKEKHSYIIFL